MNSIITNRMKDEITDPIEDDIRGIKFLVTGNIGRSNF